MLTCSNTASVGIVADVSALLSACVALCGGGRQMARDKLSAKRTVRSTGHSLVHERGAINKSRPELTLVTFGPVRSELSEQQHLHPVVSCEECVRAASWTKDLRDSCMPT